jgi:hypothetical protein
MSTNVGTPGDVNWPAAGLESKAVQISGRTICGFYIPSGWSGATFKVRVFQSENDAVGSVMIDDTGADVTYTVAAGKFLRVDPADFAGIERFSLVAGSSQSAGTTVKAATREIA